MLPPKPRMSPWTRTRGARSVRRKKDRVDEGDRARGAGAPGRPRPGGRSGRSRASLGLSVIIQRKVSRTKKTSFPKLTTVCTVALCALHLAGHQHVWPWSWLQFDRV